MKKKYTFIETGLEHIGRASGRHPIVIVVCCSIFIVAGCLGLLQAELETSPDELWIPSGTISAKQKEYFNSVFGPFYRIQQLLAVAKPAGNDVLTLSHIRELYRIQSALENVTATVSGNIVTLGQICMTPQKGGACLVNTVTDFFSFDVLSGTASITKTDITTTVSQNPYSLSAKRSRYGAPLDITGLCGGREYSGSNVIKGKAFQVVFLTNSSDSMKTNVIAWESKYMDTLRKLNDSSLLTLYGSTESSLQDEIAREIAADVVLIAVAYVVMIVFVSLSLGEFHIVKSKILVALGGILCVLASLGTSVGITAGLGMKVNPLSTQVLPFLMLGIGVDIIFILSNVFEMSPDIEDISERMAVTMRKMGPNLILTSLADVAAFAMGTLSMLPIVRAFCIEACLAVLINLFLQITCFASFICLDARRVRANRIDVLPCVRIPEKKDKNDIELTDIESKGEKETTRKRYGFSLLMSTFFSTYYGNIVTDKKSRTVIIAIFVVLLGLSTYSLTNLKKGLWVSDVVPSDSYLVPFYDELARYFPNSGPPVFAVTVQKNEKLVETDFSSLTTQKLMYDLKNELLNSKWTQNSLILSWYNDFVFWARTPSTDYGNHGGELIYDSSYVLIPQSKFYEWLPAFISNNDFQAYRLDLHWENKTGEMKVLNGRMMVYCVGLNSTEDYVNSMTDLRAIVAKPKYDTLPSFIFSPFHAYFEQYLGIEAEAVQNQLSAIAAVFAVSVLLFVERSGILIALWNSFMIFGTIVLITVVQLGLMAVWGVELNGVSAVNLVMGIGLSVEFCAHTQRGFMISSGTRNERTKNALVLVGASVFSGAVSTLLSILPLSAAKYTVFRVYSFRMYLGVVLSGILHGLILLPCLLSLIGPPEQEENDTK